MSIITQMAVTGANASIGLAVVALFDVNPVGPLVLAPVVAMVAIASRRHALQAAERLASAGQTRTVTMGQGYWFARPQPPVDLTPWLLDHSSGEEVLRTLRA